MKTFSAILLLYILFLSSFVYSGEPEKINVSTWLRTDPIIAPLPDTAEETDVSHHVTYEMLSPESIVPVDGTPFFGDHSWFVSQSSGEISISPEDPGDMPQIVYLAVYLDANCWQEISLDLITTQSYNLYLDGASVTSKTAKPGSENNKPDSSKHKLKLENRVHTLLIKSVFDPRSERSWQLQVMIERDPC